MSDVTEATFRNKVIWFSFAFSLLVVWVHSYNAELYLGKTAEMEQIYKIERIFGEGIAQIAVPAFFMISGYLFYRDFTWGKLKEKWSRRIQSVLTPYILWNFLYYLGYVIASRLPWLHEVVGKGVIPFHLTGVADAVINYTYNYVFWYLFQLILLILLAPVLYPVLNRKWSRIVFFILLGGILLADVQIPLLNADALLYYSVAAACALSPDGRRIVEERGREQNTGEKMPEKTLGLFQKDGADAQGRMSREMIARIGISVLLFLTAVCSYRFGISHALPFGFVICRLSAVTGLWLFVSGKWLPPVRDFMNHNFFLYATHFAVVRFLNKAGAKVLHITPVVPLVLFLIMPVLALIICTLAGRALRFVSPKLWKLLNGNR